MTMLTIAHRAAAKSAEVRRRLGDTPSHPASSIDRDYDDQERQAVKAVEEWKSQTGRKFPVVSEIFHVFKKCFPVISNPLDLMEEARHAVVIVDHAGLIRCCNRSARDAGLSSEVAVGRRIQEFVMETAEVSRAISEALSGKSTQLSVLSLSVPGRESWWLATVSPSQGGASIVMERIVNIFDFTE